MTNQDLVRKFVDNPSSLSKEDISRIDSLSNEEFQLLIDSLAIEQEKEEVPTFTNSLFKSSSIDSLWEEPVDGSSAKDLVRDFLTEKINSKKVSKLPEVTEKCHLRLKYLGSLENRKRLA